MPFLDVAVEILSGFLALILMPVLPCAIDRILSRFGLVDCAVKADRMPKFRIFQFLHETDVVIGPVLGCAFRDNYEGYERVWKLRPVTPFPFI